MSNPLFRHLSVSLLAASLGLSSAAAWGQTREASPDAPIKHVPAPQQVGDSPAHERIERPAAHDEKPAAPDEKPAQRNEKPAVRDDKPAPALTPALTRKIYEDAKPSLVAVQYTYTGELATQDLIGQGIIVSEDGLVMTSIGLIPTQIPDAQLKSFKIIIPGDDETEIDATFVGRDERSNVAFVRATKPQKWKAIKFEENPAQVGDAIFSVGLLPKAAGYHAFISTATVSANLRGPTPQVLVSASGLTTISSPVFNARGQAIGLVNAQVDQSILLNDPRNAMGSITSPGRMYIPSRDFLVSLSDPPVAGTPMKFPWLGIANLGGLKKDVLEAYKLTGQTAVQVGDVVKDTAADKAGIKAGDIIVKVDGKPLERGDEPDEAAAILLHKVRRMKVGTELTFSIMSATDTDKPPHDVTLTLAERPRMAHEAERYYAQDLGFATREMVFDDTYARKIPADTKGVVVAMVKPSSAAQSGHLNGGDLITQLNREPVTDLEQFKKAYQDFRKDKPTEPVVLQVRRGVNTEVIRIEPPQ